MDGILERKNNERTNLVMAKNRGTKKELPPDLSRKTISFQNWQSSLEVTRTCHNLTQNCRNLTRNCNPESLRIERVGDASLLDLQGAGPPMFRNEDVYNTGGLGLREGSEYAVVAEYYREMFCRRCYVYDCSAHGLNQPIPLAKRPDPQPFNLRNACFSPGDLTIK